MATTSRSRPSAAASRGPTPLPPYQPLSNPLNQEAIHALQTFTRTYPLTALTNRQVIAVSSLSDIAADINERYCHRSLTHHRSTSKRAESGQAEDEVQAAKIEKMGQDTQELTAKMEEAIRAVVDSKAHTQSVEAALRELSTKPGGRSAPTQSTLGASQFRGQKRRRQNTGTNNNDDDADSTSSASPAPEAQEGPISFFRHTLSTSTTAYASLSQREKYASNNDYISFRRILHESQHPGDDAPPVPHASTWFASSASDPAANDSDEDLQVAREKRSIRCPITLRPMQDPVTSTKCPHSFEREAIFDMLSASSLTVATQPTQSSSALSALGAAKKEKAIKCPECAVILRAGDLAKDEALVRKIRRMRAREEEREAGDEDEDVDLGVGMGGANGKAQRLQIGSSPGPEVRVKREAAARSQSQRQREVSMVPATQLSGEEDSYEMGGETQLENDDEDGVVSMEEEEADAEEEEEEEE